MLFSPWNVSHFQIQSAESKKMASYVRATLFYMQGAAQLQGPSMPKGMQNCSNFWISV
jgi:hypothetical protein